MTKDLIEAGFGLPAVQIAGRWRSPRMPAHYGRSQSVVRGAIARYHDRQG